MLTVIRYANSNRSAAISAVEHATVAGGSVALYGQKNATAEALRDAINVALPNATIRTVSDASGKTPPVAIVSTTLKPAELNAQLGGQWQSVEAKKERPWFRYYGGINIISQGFMLLSGMFYKQKKADGTQGDVQEDATARLVKAVGSGLLLGGNGLQAIYGSQRKVDDVRLAATIAQVRQLIGTEADATQLAEAVTPVREKQPLIERYSIKIAESIKVVGKGGLTYYGKRAGNDGTMMSALISLCSKFLIIGGKDKSYGTDKTAKGPINWMRENSTLASGIIDTSANFLLVWGSFFKRVHDPSDQWSQWKLFSLKQEKIAPDWLQLSAAMGFFAGNITKMLAPLTIATVPMDELYTAIGEELGKLPASERQAAAETIATQIIAAMPEAKQLALPDAIQAINAAIVPPAIAKPAAILTPKPQTPATTKRHATDRPPASHLDKLQQRAELPAAQLAL